MKKRLILIFILAFALFVGCSQKDDAKDAMKKSDKTATESSDRSEKESSKEDEPKDEAESEKESDSKVTATDDKKSDATSNKTQSSTNGTTPKENKPNPTTPSTESKPSNQQPTTTKPVVSEESVDTPIGETEEGLPCYEYAINGIITDWIAENDLVYTVFRNVNRYVIFDTNTGEIVLDKPLSGRPGKIRKYGNDMWISFPDLRCIKVYDARSFSLKNTIQVKKSVHAFDVYQDYLFFAEDDQHVQVFRYNLKNSDIINIGPTTWATFYEADIFINGEHGLVYIGESGSTGSVLYCYDMETLELKSKYKKDNYGYTNWRRRMYLLDNSIYWGEFQLNALDVSQVEAQYTGSNSAGIIYVDDYFVVTTGGIYLRETCEHLLEENFNSIYTAIVITKSGNILMTENERLYIVSQK